MRWYSAKVLKWAGLTETEDGVSHRLNCRHPLHRVKPNPRVQLEHPGTPLRSEGRLGGVLTGTLAYRVVDMTTTKGGS